MKYYRRFKDISFHISLVFTDSKTNLKYSVLLKKYLNFRHYLQKILKRIITHPTSNSKQGNGYRVSVKSISGIEPRNKNSCHRKGEWNIPQERGISIV